MKYDRLPANTTALVASLALLPTHAWAGDAPNASATSAGAKKGNSSAKRSSSPSLAKAGYQSGNAFAALSATGTVSGPITKQSISVTVSSMATDIMAALCNGNAQMTVLYQSTIVKLQQCGSTPLIQSSIASYQKLIAKMASSRQALGCAP